MVTESLLYELNRRIEENENKTEEEEQNVAVTKIACDCIAQPIQRMKRTEKPSAKKELPLKLANGSFESAAVFAKFGSSKAAHTSHINEHYAASNRE